MLRPTWMSMDSMRKQTNQCAQCKLKIVYKTWQQELLSKRFLKEIQIFWFPCCSTREDLSIDVSITNVGLILTKPGRFLFSWYGQTDRQTDGQNVPKKIFDWEITLLAARQPHAKKVRGRAIVPPEGHVFGPWPGLSNWGNAEGCWWHTCGLITGDAWLLIGQVRETSEDTHPHTKAKVIIFAYILNELQ